MHTILHKGCLPLFVLMMGLSGTVQAHHSQAHFSKEYSEIKGEIVNIIWRNPHVKFDLKMQDENGKTINQHLETNSIYYLERAGIKKGRIKVGDQVVVGGYAPVKAGGDYLAASMLIPDGETLEFIRDAVTKRFKDKLVDTAAENKGIFRVWSIPQNNKREIHIALTEQAKAKKATFDPLNNFSTSCEPSGMPRLMWYPHPYEFVSQDSGDVLLLKTEMYDSVRTIHMNKSQPPAADIPYSKFGYSTGAWQDGKLIVTTSRVDWAYFDTRGTPQSNKIEIVEEFTLSEDQSRLDFFITATDPESFTEPATIKAHWLALGEEIKPYKCEVD